MKKLLLAMLMLTATLTAQSQVFNGVKVSGSLSSMVEKYKEKGWKFQKYLDGTAVLKGSVGGYYNCEMFIYPTGTKQVAKVVVYLPEQSTWSSIKSTYDAIVHAYYVKYDQPDLRYQEFLPPYDEGDGYEKNAVELEKTNIKTIWLNRENGNYGVEITKWMQVKIVCENVTNMRIREREQNNSIVN